jgi:hypothetical protein
VTSKRFYVYVIYVDGVVRYVGKGSNGRIHFHVIEAQRINGRRVRGAKTDRTSTNFYRKLAEAMRRGATIREEIVLSGLTNKAAYRFEKQSNCTSRIDLSFGTPSTRQCWERPGKSTNVDDNWRSRGREKWPRYRLIQRAK